MKIAINDKTQIDLSTLIDTRLLVQANSGGGKSWLLRRILEQSHGKVQQIILDLEGEFSTLREKYDYILAGKDGDIPVEIKSAKLLARKLLELNVSTIVDLYELNHFERKQFVKIFLDSLVNAPKNLWHPCIVVIDEAHFFCPEKGQSEASSAVIDLATRGRKRGYCAILATQRLSKLHKDAAAECNNKLIGRTGLDVDMKRAAEELGFTSKEQYLSLRTLNPGEFFAFGPAISNEVIKVTVGEVETTHPKAGSRILTQTVPPTAKIRSVLSQLQDLPQIAQEEEETIESLKKQIFELKRNQGPEKVGPSEIDIEKILKPHLVAFQTAERNYKDKIEEWKIFSRKLKGVIGAVLDASERAKELGEPEDVFVPEKSIEITNIKLPDDKPKYTFDAVQNENDNQLPLAARKIYSFLAANPDQEFSKVQISVVVGYSSKSGGFNNALSQLSTRGLIKRNGNKIALESYDPSLADPTMQEKYTPEIWFAKLPLAPNKIFKILWSNPSQLFSKTQIGDLTGYSSTSGGFNNAISKLNSLGLLKRVNGDIRLNPEILNI